MNHASDPNCLFCRVVAKEVPSTTVREDDDTYAFRDIDPRAPTHVLVVPKRHIPSVDDLGPDDADVIARLVLAAQEVAAREGLNGGYRLVVNTGGDAGQSVSHLHVHVLGGRSFAWPPG